jgi:hypothetical protein
MELLYYTVSSDVEIRIPSASAYSHSPSLILVPATVTGTRPSPTPFLFDFVGWEPRSPLHKRTGTGWSYRGSRPPRLVWRRRWPPAIAASATSHELEIELASRSRVPWNWKLWQLDRWIERAGIYIMAKPGSTTAWLASSAAGLDSWSGVVGAETIRLALLCCIWRLELLLL